jgi:hypothetical protein
MDIFLDSLFLSRLQFALTTIIHIIWPVLSIGLSLFLLIIEILWFKTGKEIYYRHARFWSRLFLLNFGVGVVTGIPLEFQFGTNWAPYSKRRFFWQYPGLRSGHGLHAGSWFSGDYAVRLEPGCARRAFVRYRHGGIRSLAIGVLDYGGKCLDANAGRRAP